MSFGYQQYLPIFDSYDKYHYTIVYLANNVSNFTQSMSELEIVVRTCPSMAIGLVRKALCWRKSFLLFRDPRVKAVGLLLRVH